MIRVIKWLLLLNFKYFFPFNLFQKYWYSCYYFITFFSVLLFIQNTCPCAWPELPADLYLNFHGHIEQDWNCFISLDKLRAVPAWGDRPMDIKWFLHKYFKRKIPSLVYGYFLRERKGCKLIITASLPNILYVKRVPFQTI